MIYLLNLSVAGWAVLVFHVWTHRGRVGALFSVEVGELVFAARFYAFLD